MIFTTLTIDNFLSYEHLEFDLNQGGTVLIVGNNGSGKSSMFDAVAWCLFGSTLKGLKSDEVCSLFSPKNTMVSLVIEEGNTVYQVVRYRKHREYANSLMVYCDGVDLTSHSVDNTQKIVNHLLGMDMKLFTNSVVFAQGHSEFFASLSDKDQKAMIENFIDTTVWDACLEETKNRYTEVEEDLNKLTRKLEKGIDKIEYLESELVELNEQHNTFEDTKKQQDKELRLQVREVLSNLKVKNNRLSKVQTLYESTEKQFDRLYEEKQKVKRCDKCNQILPFPKDGELESLKGELEGYSRDIFQQKCSIKTLESSKTRLLDDLCKLQDQGNVYDESIKRIQEQLANSKKDTKQYSSDMDNKTEELTPLSFWLEGFSNKGIKSFLFECLIPEFNNTVQQYTEILTEGEISVQLSAISTLKSGETREKFSLNINNSEGSNSHKGSSGGERRSIDLSILWALQAIARNKLKSAISFELLDEALDTLDDGHIDSVIQVLNKHSKSRTVFVVSHNDNLKANFDKVYLVDKTKRKSKVYQV